MEETNRVSSLIVVAWMPERMRVLSKSIAALMAERPCSGRALLPSRCDAGHQTNPIGKVMGRKCERNDRPPAQRQPRDAGSEDQRRDGVRDRHQRREH